MGAKDNVKSGGVIPFDHKEKSREWTLILCNFECDKQCGRRQTQLFDKSALDTRNMQM